MIGCTYFGTKEQSNNTLVRVVLVSSYVHGSIDGSIAQ